MYSIGTLKRHSLMSALMVLALLSFTLGSGAAIAVDAGKTDARKTHVVLQISDAQPFKQTLVLNVAKNLIKHYGKDKVDIEIVAFGPGLRLLFFDNANSGRIEGLAGKGVTFAACANTIAGMTKKLGHAPELSDHAVKVSAGVVRIIDLQNQGYHSIKP